ncbi:uncharacterized protein BO95DRAFT_391087 [Aspergillus brunneoviolaceus CBS 621.78]|uniref:Uncharacterized protein n=1 Tax=Aspergillus brunneoviolaceus CBS 621.78 TaxID=1450534 RepID=A0ACD1G734_9EURO|nr:hypothetical protein BO95DRAFT_391087 [Aspergillus brunneoviolaceus CBS 621.78]RAH44977.1 hypothetical protein BO95DRAFT_391087 [Aspergillus brunneoviolaceus CBS 621.78]
MRLTSLLITALLSRQGIALAHKTTGPYDDLGSFQDPAPRVRPRFRYWLPDASVDSRRVQQNIKDAGALGAGGVEFLPFYAYGSEVPGADWATYGFGTPAYLEIFKAALQAHKEAGLAMDFPLGPNQGQGVPARYDDEGLQWDLAPYKVAIPSNGTYDGRLPGWDTGDLVALVSAQILSARNITGPTVTTFYTVAVEDHMQYVLKNATLQDWTDNVSSEGTVHLNLPSSQGETYLLFAFYQYRTHTQNLPVNSNMTGTIFDNGSYIVDHFSAQGAQVVTRFWDDYLLEDAEIKELLSEVGNYGWEDSIEATSNISWTPSLPKVFYDKYGYDLKRYLPLFVFGNNNIGIQTAAPGSIQCLLDTPDQGKGYVNDFRGAVMKGYQAYVEHYTNWTNAMNLQYSSQVGYNIPVDVLANVPYVNAPECESLQHQNNVDSYRQFSGPAILAGKEVISNELGAVTTEAYSHTITELLWQVNRAAAGGVNQVVLHGQSYSGDYYNTTWPGYTAFFYLFSDSYSEKQPYWGHGFSEALNHIARLQYSQRKGVPKVDLVVYSKDSASDPYLGTIYNQSDLIEHGYTYVYLSPENFALPQAYVKNGSLAPDGPEFRAMIITRSSNLTLDAVIHIKNYARAGLPVILSDGLPNIYFTEDGTETATRAELASLQATQNVHTVAAGQAASKLSALGISPRVKVQADGTWYSTWRTDSDGTDYLFILSDLVKSAGRISVATTKQPYSLDPWTGKESPLLAYQQEFGRTIIPFSFAANQTAILVFRDTMTSATSLRTTDIPTSIIGHEYSQAGSLHLHVSSSSLAKTSLPLSNGKTITQLTNRTVAPSITLSNWTLTVEHWSHPLNIRDASTVALKHNTTHRLTSLVSWRDIPAIANASGIGYYTHSLAWSPSASASGAYLLLPKATNGARVYVNGHRVPPFDYQAPKINISPYLHAGANEITVEVPSVMWNYLRSIFDELWTGGIYPANVFRAYGGLPGTVDNGLIGEATVVPYVNVHVG